MAKKSPVKRAVAPVPQSRDEAADFVRGMGQESRAIEQIKAALNEQTERLQAAAMERIKPHVQKRDQYLEGVYAYAQANRAELTEDEKRKSVDVATGVFGWRWTPPKVAFKDEEKVIAACKALGHPEFVRVKEEVAKDKMLADIEVARSIKGVTIEQKEEFYVKPAEMDVEVSAKVEKLKKAVAA